MRFFKSFAFFSANWSAALWKVGLLACIPVGFCAIVGDSLVGQLSASIAVGGAFTVGMGCLQRYTRFAMTPMVLAWIGVTLGAYLGSVVGANFTVLLAVAAVFSALSGLASMQGAGATWICQQAAIALFVAGSFPGPQQAASRALMVACGGAVQMVFLGCITALFPSLRPPPVDRAVMDTVRPVAFATALRCALASTLAFLLVHALHLSHSYWAPMTAIVVLKPSLHDELTSVIQRSVGTVVGGLVVTAFAAYYSPSHGVFIALVCALAALAYALNRVNYAYFSGALTAYIVMNAALIGAPDAATARQRALATVCGCGVAVLVDLVLKVVGLNAGRVSRAVVGLAARRAGH